MDRTIFVTARTSSTRLPGKCLLEVAPGVPAIKFLLNRLNKHGYFIVLCTSDSPNDDNLCEVVRKTGIASVFRGPEENKLKRWIECANIYRTEFFVTADGDDLFVEPELIDMAFNQYRHNWSGFINCPNTPSGSFSWGIDTRSLERVYNKNYTGDSSTEMGWAWFDDIHELYDIPKEFLRKDIRMTLDYDEDLSFFRKVIQDIGNKPLREIIKYLDSNRHVADINISRESDWKANQKALVDKIK